VRVGLLGDFDQLVEDMVGRRQVGIAHAQVDNVLRPRAPRPASR
jgi:hypothetical protein